MRIAVVGQCPVVVGLVRAHDHSIFAGSMNFEKVRHHYLVVVAPTVNVVPIKAQITAIGRTLQTIFPFPRRLELGFGLKHHKALVFEEWLDFASGPELTPDLSSR